MEGVLLSTFSAVLMFFNLVSAVIMGLNQFRSILRNFKESLIPYARKPENIPVSEHCRILRLERPNEFTCAEMASDDHTHVHVPIKHDTTKMMVPPWMEYQHHLILMSREILLNDGITDRD